MKELIWNLSVYTGKVSYNTCVCEVFNPHSNAWLYWKKKLAHEPMKILKVDKEKKLFLHTDRQPNGSFHPPPIIQLLNKFIICLYFQLGFAP